MLGEGAGLPVGQVQVHLPQPARQGVRRRGDRGLREEVQPRVPLCHLPHGQAHPAPHPLHDHHHATAAETIGHLEADREAWRQAEADADSSCTAAHVGQTVPSAAADAGDWSASSTARRNICYRTAGAAQRARCCDR